jgi:Orsellinic acid/F9775 biosynthesis cluster protein D
MEDIHSYVTYAEELEALICRSCQHGLNPNGVQRHFQRVHKALPFRVRKRIVEWCDGLIVRRLEDVQTPTTEVDAIDGLKVTDGFICGTCDAVCGTPLSIRKHCRIEHNWTLSKSDYSNYLRKR